ncbi:MAG: aminomethyl-transferring glycine dehydrogenase, partial [Pseudolysinimonas sp.]
MADLFADRHVGTDSVAQLAMLEAVGYDTVDALMDAAVPDAIRLAPDAPTSIPPAASERETLAELRAIASRNRVQRSMIGLGYYDTITPAVIQRNVLENPSWYSAYTPYQPEISQGRLEALINFQTMVTDLTGMTTANASMLDEATAVVEGMLLARRASGQASNVFLVDPDAMPQTKALLAHRADAVGIVLADLDADAPAEAFGAFIQYPGASGRVWDPSSAIAAVKERDGITVVAADLLALTLLKSPGELGADIAVGTSQRFGVPMGFGGPHAGYMAVRAGLERQLPGRLVGVSQDANGYPAYRLSLQTREQHIRREKATSNICTAQVLLAVMAGMYAVYHGPGGLKRIAHGVNRLTGLLADALGDRVVHAGYFDTLTVTVENPDAVVASAAEAGINIWRASDSAVQFSVDETTTPEDAQALLGAFGVSADLGFKPSSQGIGKDLARTSTYLEHDVFNTHRSETSMMRYLKYLADKDYALDRGMIPLGSCTMKLNAATEMTAVSWPEFAGIHPFAPEADVEGYLGLIEQLQGWLAEVTGYDAVSLQPNAGSQGELAGLLAIRGYHRANGDTARVVCLIPSSAHGTNAASAVLAGMKVVVVACDGLGNVDLADLRAKVTEHAAELAALMVTYPSTHGVYEHDIREIADAVHDAGGQVYVDGANLNALLGYARFGDFGGDVSHLNLHKTFCIPHGGGGPGVGPVAVKAHLAPFLPGHFVLASAAALTPGPSPADGRGEKASVVGRGEDKSRIGGTGERSSADTPDVRIGAVAAAPYGSASILPISWMYVTMMGGEGLRAATESAILAANYVARRLAPHYPVLYAGHDGLVAHECILDLRPLKLTSGIEAEDVAKRLMDYG